MITTIDRGVETGPLVEPAGTAAARTIVPGSALARVLYEVATGTPVVVVQSPPGAGKSTLIAELVGHLVSDGSVVGQSARVTVCTPTRNGSAELAKKVSAQTGPGAVLLAGASFRNRDIDGVLTDSDRVQSRVDVRTVASAKMARRDSDIMIFDEAYQCTFADVISAAEQAQQIVLVGDPGQIGPVNALDVTPWSRMKVGPHLRAPEGFLHRDDVSVVTLPSSFRLGPDTVAAIAPLYEFGFHSTRIDTSLDGFAELESLSLPPVTRVADPTMVQAVVARVSELVTSDVHGGAPGATMAPENVAVVVARNEQRAALGASLTSAGLDDVTVGTADSLQGGEWLAVVAVDPFLGSQTGSAHAASTGRLCVMASRHQAHLTWVYSEDWREVIRASQMPAEDRDRHISVRESLTRSSA